MTVNEGRVVVQSCKQYREAADWKHGRTRSGSQTEIETISEINLKE